MKLPTSGYAIPTIPPINTTRTTSDPGLRHVWSSIEKDLASLIKLIYKPSGPCNTDYLLQIALGVASPSSVRQTSLSLSSFVRMLAQPLAQLDSVMNQYSTQERPWKAVKNNRIIALINARIEIVNRCVQLGSESGLWPGSVEVVSVDDVEAICRTIRWNEREHGSWISDEEGNHERFERVKARKAADRERVMSQAKRGEEERQLVHQQQEGKQQVVVPCPCENCSSERVQNSVVPALLSCLLLLIVFSIWRFALGQ